MIGKSYYLLKVDVLEENTEELHVFLSENISWGWEEDGSTIKIYFSTKYELNRFVEKLSHRFTSLRFEVIPYHDLDWSDEWKKYFTPIDLLGFKVIPSWEREKTEVKKGQIPIYIYPEMAFGTGHHPTTKLCLLSLLELFKSGKIYKGCSFLDVGTGSGILGIGSSLLGLKGIGLDIDICVLTNCKTNIDLNQVTTYKFFIGTLEAIKKHIKFHLIFGNILLETLLHLRDELLTHLRTGGYLITSGILIEQEDEIIKSYSPFLRLVKTMREGEWSSMIWKKGN